MNLDHSELLFSYGTLQLEKVQLTCFGRLFSGEPDELLAHELSQVKITDPEVLAASNLEFHPIALATLKTDATVKGTLLKVSEAELVQSDLYEVSDYKRVKTSFKSGKNGWVYVKA
jgi:gamma-glutamylcyclotransferase (GGCT)/AIG2-like uncharacterized protein YtfP